LHMNHCVKCDCKNTDNKPIREYLFAPFECDDPKICDLLAYFLHKAPDIESAHSDKIDRSIHESIYRSLIDGRHFYYEKITFYGASISVALKKCGMEGDIFCVKCKRLVCRKKSKEESNLDCLLRHIRNSIAHGYVYYVGDKKTKHIVFDDYNKRHNLSARIICVQSDLENWKTILNKQRNN